MITAQRMGFCPKEIIFKEEVLQKIGSQAKEVIYALGSRISCIKYTMQGRNGEKSYIAEIILREESELGLRVAEVLKEMIPHCKFGITSKNKKIECNDINNMELLSSMICKDKEGWMLTPQEIVRKSYILEDDKYLVLIRKKDEIVQMYCCKK